jgi:hypothetical protein
MYIKSKRFWHTVGNVGNRLTLHAGFEGGFVLCAQLMYKAGLVNSSYHSHINSCNFEKWLKEKLTPNILERSQVIFENAVYKHVDKPLSKHTEKEEMISWLLQFGYQ